MWQILVPSSTTSAVPHVLNTEKVDFQVGSWLAFYTQIVIFFKLNFRDNFLNLCFIKLSKIKVIEEIGTDISKKKKKKIMDVILTVLLYKVFYAPFNII